MFHEGIQSVWRVTPKPWILWGCTFLFVYACIAKYLPLSYKHDCLLKLSLLNCLPFFVSYLFLVWDQGRFCTFNWLWYDVTSYDDYTEETSYENSLLVRQSGALTLSSINHVLKSVPPNVQWVPSLTYSVNLFHQCHAHTKYENKIVEAWIGRYT